MDTDKKYFAFISYKREDEEWAKWLQHKLEHYRLPSNLNGNSHLPKEIRPIFRDQSDLAGGVLAEEINNALENSQYLIVICSPRAARSEWVGKEVETFIEMGRIDKIIPFIIGGTAHAINPEDECFPLSLRELPAEKEILGVNINEMGRDAAVVKVVAQMFGLKFDELWQRYEREKKRKVWLGIGIALFITLISIVVVGYFLHQNNIIERQNNQLIEINQIIDNQNNQLKETNSIIENHNNQLKEINWNMMSIQSKAVAEKAMKLISDGNNYTASMLALAVLPENLQFPDRPYCVEAERALRSSTYHNSAILKGHIDRVETALFNYDGTMIVSASLDGTIRVWDSNNGVELIKLENSDGIVSCASFSPNSEQIVAGYRDGNVRIWDVKTNTVVKILKGHTGNILSCSYSHNGKYIISSAGGDNTIRLWDAQSGQVLRIMEGYTGVYNSVEFSPDDKYVVSAGGMDNYVRIWDLESGKEIKKFAAKSIYSVSYSHNGKYIVASSSGDNSAQIWDIQSGRKILSLYGHSDYVENASFSPDDKYIATASADGKIIIWNAKDGKRINQLSGHSSVVNTVSFDPKGNKLVSSSWDKTIRLWDLQEYSRSKIIEGNYRCAVSQSADLLVSLSNKDQMLHIWNLESDNEIRQLKDKSKYFEAIGFSPDAKYILCIADSTIKLLDANSGDLQYSFKCGNYLTGAFCFSPDGKLIAFGDGTILKVLDVENSKITKKMCARTDRYVSVFCENISSISFSPNGKYVATATYMDKTIRVWNIETGTLIRQFNGHRDAVTSVSFSPNGGRLVSGAYDNTVRVWDMDNDNHEIMRLDGNGFYSVSYSPDGRYIFAGGNPDVYVWDAESGSEIQNLNGHTKMISLVEYCPTGKNIVSFSDDGTIRIWDFPPLQELIDQTRERFKDRPLTPEERHQYYLE